VPRLEVQLVNVPLSNPDVTEAEVAAVAAVLRTDRLSIGPHVEAFEALCAKRAGRKYGIAVSSGTSGLHLCVRGLGIGEGDEVVTTPFSFVATTNVVLFERAKPVFVDIDPVSYNADPDAMQAAITPRTKAILPVEVFGNPAHFSRYESIARAKGLRMIEDCCEALGGVHALRPTGSFGDCGVFAFYPNKQITTGEGGMIVTDDAGLTDLCRSMRNQGRDTSEWLQHARLGYNYRMSEINAVLGEHQVRRLDEILAKRRRSAAMYNHALDNLAQSGDIVLPPMEDQAAATWFVYVIRLADRFAPGKRDEVMASLRSQGVSCNPYFAPIHLQPYVMDMLGTRKGQFPITERIAARTIALPFFSNLTEAQVQRVTTALKKALS
jgi:perosamine synthetase